MVGGSSAYQKEVFSDEAFAGCGFRLGDSDGLVSVVVDIVPIFVYEYVKIGWGKGYVKTSGSPVQQEWKVHC